VAVTARPIEPRSENPASFSLRLASVSPPLGDRRSIVFLDKGQKVGPDCRSRQPSGKRHRGDLPSDPASISRDGAPGEAGRMSSGLSFRVEIERLLIVRTWSIGTRTTPPRSPRAFDDLRQGAHATRLGERHPARIALFCHNFQDKD
jgi:hypothetical protein